MDKREGGQGEEVGTTTALTAECVCSLLCFDQTQNPAVVACLPVCAFFWSDVNEGKERKEGT